jgi:hypothetical protein
MLSSSSTVECEKRKDKEAHSPSELRIARVGLKREVQVRSICLTSPDCLVERKESESAPAKIQSQKLVNCIQGHVTMRMSLRTSESRDKTSSSQRLSHRIPYASN